MEFISTYHPFVVHFPLALLTLYSFIEFLALIFKNDKLNFTANVLLTAGVAGGLAAVLTGNLAAQIFLSKEFANLAQGAIETLESHENYATILLWYFCLILAVKIFWTLKKTLTKGKRAFIVVFALLGLYLIIMSGYYGGKLVLDYGIGTQILK